MSNEIAKPQHTEPSVASEFDEVCALVANRHMKSAKKVAAEAFGKTNPPNLVTSGGLNKTQVTYALAGHIEHGSQIFRTMLAKDLTELEDSSGIIGTMYAIEPRDGVEQVLASQMAKVESALQRMFRGLEKAEHMEQLSFYEGAINRLSRTFAAQVETLRKHRTGGVQTVKHVHVNEGGQAIVADTVSTTHVGKGEGGE